MTPVRVLLSARDPAAAAQVATLAPVLRAEAGVDMRVVASAVALEILARAGLGPLPFALLDGSTHVPPDGDPAPLLREARQLLTRLDPDALVVGISSLGVGIDEALLACADGRPTFGLQDYPGDANAIGGAFAGVYFVRDEGAADLTRRRFGVTARPVGSLRHAAYRRLDVTGLREATRRRLGAPESVPVVGFFGQPAAIPGHEESFRHLVGALAGWGGRVVVILREHPKAMALRQVHVDALRATGAVVFDASDDDEVEPWLAACDVVTTCFSHCTMDYAFLSASSPQPLGSVLFLLTTPEVRQFMRSYSGLEVPDGVGVGLGEVVEEPTQVRQRVEALLGEEARGRFHLAARRLPRDADLARIVRDVTTAAGTRTDRLGVRP